MRTIGAIAVELNAKTDKFQRRFGAAEKTMTRFANRTKMLGTQMAALGRKMTMTVTLPLLALSAATVKAFAGFDKAMTESLAIVSNVAAKTKEVMRGLALEMSTKSTFAAKELARAYYFLASAGFSALQSLKALKPVTKFAQAGAFDLSTATSLLAGSQSALGLKVKDTEQNMKNMLKVSDVLTRVTTLADATTEQFAVALTRAGASMAAYNIPLESGVAVLAALAEKQRKAEVGGEMFSRILRLMIPAANKNAKAYEELGIRVFDTIGNLRNFADILEDIEGALDDMSTSQKSASLVALGFRARVQGAILPLIGMSGSIREYEKTLMSAAGTTDRIAKEQLTSFSAQLKLSWSQVVKTSIGIGEKLVPTIIKLTKSVGKVLKWFEKLSDSQVEQILKWGGIVAAIGPVLFAVGGITKGFALLTKGTFASIAAFKGLIALSPKVVAAFTAINVASIPAKGGFIGLALAGGVLAGRFLNWLSEFTGESLEDRMVKFWAFMGIREKKLTQDQLKNLRILEQIQKAKIAALATEGKSVKDLGIEIEKLTKGYNERYTRSRKVIQSYLDEGRSATALMRILRSQTGAYLKQKGALEELIAIRNFRSRVGGVLPTEEGGKGKWDIAQGRVQEKLLAMTKARREEEEDMLILRSKMDTLEKDVQEEAYRFTRKQIREKKRELDIIKGILDIEEVLAKEEEKKTTDAFKARSPRYAGALEKGSVAAYSAGLDQLKTMNKVEKNTKDQVDYSKKMVERQDQILINFRGWSRDEVMAIP